MSAGSYREKLQAAQAGADALETTILALLESMEERCRSLPNWVKAANAVHRAKIEAWNAMRELNTVDELLAEPRAVIV